MASIHQPFLFRWNDVDAQSDLNRLRLVLESLPDEDFMSELEQERGRGRNDYPILPCWTACGPRRQISPSAGGIWLWIEGTIRPSNVDYDESGHLFCTCPQTHVIRKMVFRGFEKDRKCLKFQCPAVGGPPGLHAHRPGYLALGEALPGAIVGGAGERTDRSLSGAGASRGEEPARGEADPGRDGHRSNASARLRLGDHARVVYTAPPWGMR